MGTGQALTAQQLVGLLERVPDVVWRYRLLPTRGFEYVTPSVFALTGYTPAEHYENPDLGLEIVHPDDAPMLAAALQDPEEHATISIRWRHRRGAIFTTEHRIVPLRNARGQLVALEGVARPVISLERSLQMPAGDLVLDLVTHHVLVDGRRVQLTPAEHVILALLAATDGPVSSRAIVTRLWGENHPGGARAVQVHISNLRRKIERDHRRPRRILTHRRLGYSVAHVEAEADLKIA